MPGLNFKAQFAPLVESGKKRQTIRATRKYPIKVGDTLYLYTGMRTKQCRKLGEAVCKEIAGVVITEEYISVFPVPCCPKDTASISEIARADGFKSSGELVLWFKKTHGLPFEGQLIRW